MISLAQPEDLEVTPSPIIEPTNPLARALSACRRHFLGVVSFSALLNLLFLIPMLYMLQVYDRVVPTRGGTTLLLLTLILLYGLATLALLDFARSRLLVRASVRLDRVLAGGVLQAMLEARTGTMESLARQPMREFDQLRQTLTGQPIIALADLPWTPVFIIVSFLIDPILGLVILLGTAALAALAWRNDRQSTAQIEQANQKAARAYASQEEAVASADVVRALGMQRAMVARHLNQRQTMLESQTNASFAASRNMTLGRFLRLALQSLALGLGALLAINDRVSPGAIFVASYLAGRALQPVDQILSTWPQIARAKAAYQSLEALLANSERAWKPTKLPNPSGRIEVQDLVVLGDGGDPILNRLSFAAHAGDAVAIIGPSGAGKSTLLRSLAGAISPASGSIRIDGAEQSQWDAEDLARFIGFLPQETTLFAGTVADNIARFQTALETDRSTIDEASVKAAKECGAHDLILRLANGYDTALGWGGRGLSAGQAQRIGLARAMYRDPALVLLDEPNAHLDAEGEAALTSALEILKERGATVLVASHRADVLSAVDKILFLRDGKVELYGPRDDVLTRLQDPHQVIKLRPRRGGSERTGNA